MKVLVIAPHADDETLGVGGTIRKHVEAGDQVVVAVMTGPGEEPHPIFKKDVWETVRSEASRAMEVLGVEQLLFREIPAVLVPDQPVWEINREAAQVLSEVQPDILYVPFPFDLHLDHRAIFYAFSVAWRPHGPIGQGVKEIYCYETVSETHWNPAYLETGFTPNVYVDISSTVEKKIEAMECYASQLQEAPHARSLKALRDLAGFRGAQVSVEAAEAFVLIRKLA